MRPWRSCPACGNAYRLGEACACWREGRSMMGDHPHPEIEGEGQDGNHHDEVEDDCEADNARVSWEDL